MAQYITKINTNKGPTQIDYTALANKPMISNENLLINSDFRRPVNQRDKTTYSYNDTTTQYTIDRWRSTGANVTVGNEVVTIKNASGRANTLFCQPFERNLEAGTYSVMINCGIVTGSVYVSLNENGSDKRKLVSGLNTFRFDVETAISCFYILFDGVNTSESVSIYYIKLERGEITTAFIPRQYAEELLLCQRYYEKRTVIFFPSVGTTSTRYYIAVNGGDHHVTKRIMPQLHVGKITDNNNESADVSYSAATQTLDGIRLMTVNTECSEYLLRADIEFDAEIY